jgi:hypothetical protein
MQALRFHRFGSLGELRLEEMARPVPRPGEILVAVRAASVNPSDLKNVHPEASVRRSFSSRAGWGALHRPRSHKGGRALAMGSSPIGPSKPAIAAKW